MTTVKAFKEFDERKIAEQARRACDESLTDEERKKASRFAAEMASYNMRALRGGFQRLLPGVERIERVSSGDCGQSDAECRATNRVAMSARDISSGTHTTALPFAHAWYATFRQVNVLPSDV